MKKKCIGEKLILSGLIMSMVVGTGCGSDKNRRKNNVFDSESKEKVEQQVEDVDDSVFVDETEDEEEIYIEETVSDDTVASYTEDETLTWQKAYLDVLAAGSFKDPESEGSNVELGDDYTYDLIYVDNDIYPELLVSMNSYWAYIVSFQNGEIETFGSFATGTWGNDTQYIPYENILLSSCYSIEGEEQVWYEDYERMVGEDPIDEEAYRKRTGEWKNITNGGVYTKTEIMKMIDDSIIDINSLIPENTDYLPVVVDPSDEALQNEKFLDGFTYEDILDQTFIFCSGAGGWATTFNVKRDGSFFGKYYDSDYESGEYQGASYEGLMYYCKFTGKFGALEKVDDYTYKTTIVEMKYENQEDSREVIDDTLYIYTDAYGFEDHKDIYFYLPGKPVKDLDEDFLGWVHLDKETNMDKVLNGVYMNNEENQEGFESSNEIESLFRWLANLSGYESKDRETIKDESLDIETRVTTASGFYDTWDYYLNDIWHVLTLVKTDEEMNQLKVEERTWIQLKENTVKKAGQSITDDKERQIAEYLTGADLTKERCLQLLLLLQ